MRGSVALARLVDDDRYFSKSQDGILINFIAGVWRAGATVCNYAEETLRKRGYKIHHAPVKIESYKSGTDKRGRTREITALTSFVDRVILSRTVRIYYGYEITPENILFCDDVWDTGGSGVEMMTTTKSIFQEKMEAIAEGLPLIREYKNWDVLPNVEWASIYYKPSRNRTRTIPRFYVKSTDAWLVFPPELMECTLDEIIGNKDPIYRAALQEKDFRKWAKRRLKLPPYDGKRIFS